MFIYEMPLPGILFAYCNLWWGKSERPKVRKTGRWETPWIGVNSHGIAGQKRQAITRSIFRSFRLPVFPT